MTYKTRAFVLKSIAWPRKARLFILYTERFGKIKAAAAGVDKIKSKVAGHLQPFCLTEVMIARGRSVDRLAQGRFVQGYTHIGRDFSLLMRGSYALEVINVLSKEGVADEVIWEKFSEVMEELNRLGQWADGGGAIIDSDLLVRTFTWQVLDRIGFRPELYACVSCRNNLKPGNLAFSYARGGCLCSECNDENEGSRPVSVELVKMLRLALSRPISEITRLQLSNETKNDAIDIIDHFLALQIQRPIKTSQAMQTMQAERMLV